MNLRSWKALPQGECWCWLRRRDDGSLRMALFGGDRWRVADTLGRCTWKSQATAARHYSGWRKAR